MPTSLNFYSVALSYNHSFIHSQISDQQGSHNGHNLANGHVFFFNCERATTVARKRAEVASKVLRNLVQRGQRRRLHRDLKRLPRKLPPTVEKANWNMDRGEYIKSQETPEPSKEAMSITES